MGLLNFSTEFLIFAISIALQSYNEIICGLIFDPIKDEIVNEKDNGSFLNNKRVRVSQKKVILVYLQLAVPNIKMLMSQLVKQVAPH